MIKEDQNMIGEEGAVHLSKGIFKQLSYIGLNGNEIGDNGIKHISQGSFLSPSRIQQNWKRRGQTNFEWIIQALTHLYLFNNFIGYEGVNHLSNGLFHALKLLILMNNKIRTEATKIIINGSLKKSLRTLILIILRKNNIFKEAKDQAFSLGLTNNQEEIIQIRV